MSFSFFPSEPQQRIEDRSFSRMLWPSSSASKEVSSSSRDDTNTPLLHLYDKNVCICCTCRPYIHTWIDTYMLKHTCPPAYIDRNPLLTSHYCPSYAQIVRIWMTQLWLIRCFFMTVTVQHFLALFLPNDAATARDIWMSYIASLISAYVKLSFFSLSLSLLEIYALWPTLLTSTFCDSLK